MTTLLQQGQVFLIGNITEKKIEQLYKRLCYVENLDCKEVVLHICSGGGDVECANAIIDKMNQIGKQKTIRTIAAGKAQSAAAFIFGFGKIRQSFEHTNFMFHDCYYEMPERSHPQQKSYVEFTTKTEMILLNQLIKHCQIQKRQADAFKELIKNELWLTAAEAKKFKIVQQIV